ncbi:hypothetical protein JGI7_01705 [Candidatus Kryptonium thompsonii]|uniref:Uncharacterized protein n=1 Tax=Candidatus Kryptonium thompsonii TaxID=1633631 RepID=A0A0P1LUV5_9BACT|nr:hypothetical protein JGI16_10122 [Candidatus Kryptonium thompsoni]CUS82793.1 hypothetical protein JGI13_00841 [Candidatus Kryptonium thompsoni]CUS85649.1 hypothetical protein JGI15_10273 [Candidatus Kryptonium thompsoni]CUS86413.1 hypothetical protein JGI14_10244 [Candidatus Kryptonium thompsoni]CUS87297.1 hypothetical protein JGI8_01094 [Candidatus Kryptonium thompsoni]
MLRSYINRGFNGEVRCGELYNVDFSLIYNKSLYATIAVKSLIPRQFFKFRVIFGYFYLNINKKHILPGRMD